MADSTWGVPLAGEAMWGETPLGPPVPPIPTNPTALYITLRVSVGEPPLITEVAVRPAG